MPATDDATKPAPAHGGVNPMHLAYATPTPKSSDLSDGFDTIGYLARRFIFALGVGLFVYGVGCGWTSVAVHDAGSFMGWGAGLMALTMPWGWRRVRPGSGGVGETSPR
jgi:hypothetical protein